MSVQSIGEMENDFCPYFGRSFLENIDGSRELIPMFHNSHRKGRSSPLAVALTLEYLAGVPSKAASSGREKNQVRIYIQ